MATRTRPRSSTLAYDHLFNPIQRLLERDLGRKAIGPQVSRRKERVPVALEESHVQLSNISIASNLRLQPRISETLSQSCLIGKVSQ
jgi:hypothetical protein